MTDDRRRRLLEALGLALEAPTERRSEVVRELCGDDPTLVRELESMLELADHTDGFLAQPVEAQAADPDLATGTRLGPYRIGELLGRGGMGVVYEGHREDDFERSVAIKLLRRGLAGTSALRRFHAERQILAGLDHPGIARLLDGGTSEDGRPYLVMERVEGRRIDLYCREEGLGVAERIDLLGQVLSAVAYAHRNLVVHRDLKPSNILVTREGQPKLLDFGIAKLLDASPSQDATEGAGPLTPRYASPEQVEGLSITTASDVYSLGVLLYELLTGRLPLGLGECGALAAAVRIRSWPAEPPSRGIEQSDLETLGVSGSPVSLRRSLRGDLDAILLRALAKDPAERYASVDRFDADLRRHRQGLPVLARRQAWGYRMGKLVRRHRWAVLAILLVVASSLVSTAQWWRAERALERVAIERTEAVRERDRARKVSGFLEGLIRSANPDVAQGHQLTALEILAEGRAQLAAAGFEDDPELEAELSGTLGDVYRNLGEYEIALDLLERSVELRRGLHPEGHPDLAIALNDLASAYYYQGLSTEAAETFREALAWRRRLGESPLAIARTQSNLASALKQTGRFAEAGALYREVLAVRQQEGAKPATLASSFYSLGALEYEVGDLTVAEDLLRQALELRRQVYGEHHTGVATVEGTLGRTHQALGDLEQAESSLRRALEVRLALLGNGHAHVAYARRDLASVLLDGGRVDEAQQLLDQAWDSLADQPTQDPFHTALVAALRGAVLVATGDVEEGRGLLETNHRRLVELRGEESIHSRRVASQLAAAPAG